ncbi:MAG: hypothetical protein RLZZ436_3006 [Planctomycetota bacterium]|jgi:hypothetical protein
MVEATLSETLLWSGLRAVIVAGCALLPLLVLQRAWDGATNSRQRLRTIAVAVLSFFIPELLTGFHYRVQAAVWAAQLAPNWNACFAETLYALLQLLRAVSAGAIVLLVLPRNPGAASSLHAWSLLRPALPLRCWLRGKLQLLVTTVLPAPLVAWSVMAITVFQEFETAALMQIDRHPLAWTVWMFDAHAAQQPLSESLKMVLGPLAVELLLLLPLLPLHGAFQPAGGDRYAAAAGEQRNASRTIHLLAMTWGLAAGTVLVGIPLLRMGADTLDGLLLLLQSPRLLQQSLAQVLTSTAVSAAAACASLAICAAAMGTPANTPSKRVQKLVLVTILLLPGLAGPIASSLTLLQLFQTSLFRPLYDTWLPLLVGLILAVLPRAFALQLLAERFLRSEALHTAGLLCQSTSAGVRGRAAIILWRLVDVRRMAAVLVLTQWCFWNVTSTSILRPLDPEPAVTRLYNEMHFARTEILLGLTALSAVAPGLLFCGGLLVSRLMRKKRTRS